MSKPNSSLIVVVLPDPFGPRRPNTSPRADIQVQGLKGPDFLTAPKIPVNLGKIPSFNYNVWLHEKPRWDGPMGRVSD